MTDQLAQTDRHNYNQRSMADTPKPSATAKPSAPRFNSFKKEEVINANLTNTPPRWKKKKTNQALGQISVAEKSLLICV